MEEEDGGGRKKHFPSPSLFRLVGELSLSDFSLGATLGIGSFGRVRLATTAKKPGAPFAIKISSKKLVVQNLQTEHILSERALLEQLDHPFVVKMSAAFQDCRYLYMILEYVPGGEFFTHLRFAERFDDDTTRFYVGQVVLIFEYLHSRNIVYRDLKPENLLLDRNGFAKLVDFGFAKFLGSEGGSKTYTLCGTPEYIAPEQLVNQGHGKGVDWWALGILLYESLTGQPPFVDDEPMAIYQQILAGKLAFPRFVTRHARNIVGSLLTANLLHRLGCLKGGPEGVKQHAWFTAFNFNFDACLGRILIAPLIPSVKDENDTSNFDPYPDSTDTTAEDPVCTSRLGPFETFSSAYTDKQETQT